jgi:hypothetical protein
MSDQSTRQALGWINGQGTAPAVARLGEQESAVAAHAAQQRTLHVEGTLPPGKAVPHTHVDKQGLLHLCWHKCRTQWGPIVLGSLAINTLIFPFEHWLWHTVPPFSWVAHWFGL